MFIFRLLLICLSLLQSLALLSSSTTRTATAFCRLLPSHSTFLKVLPNGSDEKSQTETITTLLQISKVLKEKQTDLLSDASLIQSPSSDRDLTLTTQEIVRETLLSTRLSNLNLNRTRLGLSTIPGAGRGLFATQNIAKGEVITCYPGDALLYVSPSDDQENEDDDDNEDAGEDEDTDCNDVDEEEEWIDEIVLWGSHISVADQWDEDIVFDGLVGNEEAISKPPLTDYAVAVCDTYSVMGMPTLDANPAYYGHFANDSAGHFATKEADRSVGIEKGIAAYVLESVEASNAMHQGLDDSHMITIATRDVKAGEEVLVTYGPDYWMEFASRDS
jgi:hypothetical protein